MALLRLVAAAQSPQKTVLVLIPLQRGSSMSLDIDDTIRTVLNDGLAGQLATYQALFGDWRELFRAVDRIDKVGKADIRRVAKETFVASNRTVGIIESTQMAGAKDRGEKP